MSADVEVIFTPWPYDAVARGVALLDEKVPGWRLDRLMTLERFNLATDCIDPKHYGFAVPLEAVHGGDYDELMASLVGAWREAIVAGVE